MVTGNQNTKISKDWLNKCAEKYVMLLVYVCYEYLGKNASDTNLNRIGWKMKKFWSQMRLASIPYEF